MRSFQAESGKATKMNSYRPVFDKVLDDPDPNRLSSTTLVAAIER